jgi:hypothetical protein
MHIMAYLEKGFYAIHLKLVAGHTIQSFKIQRRATASPAQPSLLKGEKKELQRDTRITTDELLISSRQGFGGTD